MTNWEEYRGFYVTGTQDTFPLLQNRHERMDPRHKNVFVALSPRLEQDIVDVMPAWFNLIYKPNFDTTDSNQFIETRFVDLELRSSWRTNYRFGRQINPNEEGAIFQYFGFRKSPTPGPAPFPQDAVTFWEGDYVDQFGDIADMRTANPPIRGKAVGSDTSIDFIYPNDAVRIVIDQEAIESYSQVPYYQADTTKWKGPDYTGDYYDMLRYTATHEVAHAIGRKGHNPGDVLMYKLLPIKKTQPDSGQFFPDSTWLKDFETVDKELMTINPR